MSLRTREDVLLEAVNWILHDALHKAPEQIDFRGLRGCEC